MSMDQTALRNRLIVASGMWRESTQESLPRMRPGDPAAQIQAFELELVAMLGRHATPETARDVAAKTWDLVGERPDADPVKQQVVELHGELARLSHVERW